ncbi:MAG: VWA domain-containing protein [Gammaproteobacteria bacterium AqS3]|nr:VWA domain-containing protein [Gammaproteobacteria bacterium AqS3]
MRRALSRFAAALRTAGVRVSPAEVLDATSALQASGLDDRETVYRTLSLVMPKTVADKQRFDGVFERFFGNLEDDDELIAQILSGEEIPEDLVREVELSSATQKLLQASPLEMQPEIECAAQDVGLDDIRYFTQKPVYRRKILQQLEFEKMREDARDLTLNGETEAGDHLQDRLAMLQKQVEDVVDSRFLLYGDTDGKQLRREMLRRMNLARIDRYYQRELHDLVREMARKLATRIANRARRVRTGRLNVRRTLRRNLAYDGAIVDLYWSARRVSRPQIMVLCDVSGSVAQYALFLLMFVHGLSEVVPKLRSFAFSSSLGEVTDLFDGRPYEDAIRAVVSEHGMGSSDYARSLRDFNELALRDVNRRTTVIILGDARNNYGDPELHHLREIYLRAKRVIWLNPEHRAGWGSGDSVMQTYASCCTRVSLCHSLNHLERVIEDLLLND